MIFISRDGRRHLTESGKLYDREFENVMSFHDGIAAVRDDTGAYHINLDGNETYAHRFQETYGYYEGLAAVRDDTGAYHIDVRGVAAYGERFRWTGNFQDGLCVVRLENGRYGYVDGEGNVSDFSFKYAGDFSEGIAVVRTERGATHIRKDGTFLHGKWFDDCNNYSGGFAVVTDGGGDFKIDVKGDTVGETGFAHLGDSYNGESIAIDSNGTVMAISDSGESMEIHQLPDGMVEWEYGPFRWVDDLLSSDWDSCLAFIRHGNREPSMRSQKGTSVNHGLTLKGIENSIGIGKRLRGAAKTSLVVKTSPVERCVHTAERILEGCGKNAAIQTTKALGLPGTAFIYDTRKTDAVNRLPLTPTVIENLAGKTSPGWYSVDECARNFLEYFSDDLDTPGRLTLCVTHDNFVVRVLGFLSGKFPGDTWVECCHGGLIIKKDGASYLIWNGLVYPVDDAFGRNGVCDVSFSAKGKECMGHRPESGVKTYGTSEGLTAARDSGGFYHLDESGTPLYGERYSWVGDFKEGRCSVRDFDGMYFHIGTDGIPISNRRFDYAGDFKYSTSVVCKAGKGSTHITDTGEYLYEKWFIECRPFHKGHAAVRDEGGWFHIDIRGNGIYGERYAKVEPFYNGFALCRTHCGKKVLRNAFGGEHIDLDKSTTTRKFVKKCFNDV